MAGADILKKGDFSNLPKGMYFDFKSPIEQIKQYDNLNNVGKEGTYALGDNEGAGKAMALAGDYRKNLFARDAANNFQDNVSNAAANIKAGLGQAAGEKSATDSAVINALQNMYSQVPKGSAFMRMLPGLIGAGASMASSFIGGSSTPSYSTGINAPIRNNTVINPNSSAFTKVYSR